jgi:cytochrome bd ubiquinol oxidase subunit II
VKTAGAVSERAAGLARAVWWAVVLLTVVVSLITFRVQPNVMTNFAKWHWGVVFPLLAVAGMIAVKMYLAAKDEWGAFLGSCAYLAGMLTSVVFGVYPMVLPARNPAYALTVANAKAADYGLKIGLAWWVIGILLATGYFTFVYRSFAGKVDIGQDSHS